MLDHFPLTRDHLQRLGDGLPELAQPVAATAIASRWPRHDHTLPWDMRRERLARWALALVGTDRCRLRSSPLGGDFVLGGRALQLLELELHLIDDACR